MRLWKYLVWSWVNDLAFEHQSGTVVKDFLETLWLPQRNFIGSAHQLANDLSVETVPGRVSQQSLRRGYRRSEDLLAAEDA